MLSLRVRPEIRVMEIHAHLHAVRRRPFSKGDRRRNVIVAAAVPVSIRVIRTIPHAEADIIYAGLCQRLKDILLFSFIIVIRHAAVLQ